ncbi:MAG TPA: rod shape-determining protein MreC [Streptosporangiaceae bacterium]|nr:rod shape-determining protein MreC [Streptosporangiaceae bacterium]
MHDSRRTRVILGLLLAAALALLTVSARNGSASPVRALRSMGSAVFGTAEFLMGSVTRPTTGFLANVGNASASQAKISALEQEVTRLRAQLSMAQVSKSDEAQLQSLLQLAGRGGYRVVAANVVAYGPAYEDTVTIDVGSVDGVKPDETVLNGAGLVGEVTSVSARTATVVLDTDAAATVGVQVAGTGEVGVVRGAGRSGAGPAALTLQVFDENAVLRPGEQLVTYGSVDGRPYVPGVPVGVITQVQASANALTKLAWVQPFANDGALGVVGVVIVPPRKNPHDSVLPKPPPAPRPSPRPTHSLAPSPGVTATPTGTGG